ncbi:MAG: universal stress protein [Solirubrobacterales bacterium]
MFRQILVGYLDTEEGHEALALGKVLAQATGAEIVVASSGKERDLAHLAQAYRSDLVVLGPTHRGPISKVVPGATVERLLGQAPCAVAVAPSGFGHRARRNASWQPLSGAGDDVGMRVVGVGYDASDSAEEALATAVDLAIPNGAALRVYAVARRRALPADEKAPSRDLDAESESLRTALHESVAELPPEARALPVFLRGDPAAELIKASKAGVDLLVLGSRWGGPLRRMLHQSVTRDVIQRATCPVLISPAGVTAPQAAKA